MPGVERAQLPPDLSIAWREIALEQNLLVNDHPEPEDTHGLSGLLGGSDAM